MLPVRLRPEALDELTDAWAWYEARREGLGEEFRSCVDAAVAEIARDPVRAPRVRGEVRRKLLHRFPYALFYLPEPEHVEILAVFHMARDPRGWQDRSG